jgi:hypothetical protein
VDHRRDAPGRRRPRANVPEVRHRRVTLRGTE